MFSPYCVTKGPDWMSNSCTAGAGRRSWKPLEGYQFGSSGNCCSSSECWEGPHAGGAEIHRNMKSKHSLASPCCSGAPGGHHSSSALSSPPQSRLFCSRLDFAPAPIGAQLDSSVLYLEHTSHFCTSSLLLPVRSLVCGHSILPALSFTLSHCPEAGATLQPGMLFVALWLWLQQDTSWAHSGICFRISLLSPTSFPINSGDNIHNNFNGSMIIL